MIPGALEALTVHRQFIVYRLETSKSRPGKTDKIPCDYRTGNPANAHDPAIWLLKRRYRQPRPGVRITELDLF